MPSPAAMAFETGWSERPASAAATSWAPSLPKESRPTSTGRPAVTVPVLSKATARTPRASSSQLPPLMRMPRRAPAARPLTTVTGVASTSAQGQAITSSTSAR